MNSINQMLNTSSKVCIQQRSSSLINHLQKRGRPTNVPPTATGKRRFRMETETDPKKLVNYCCGLNYHKDEPPVKLKPANEYPEWLWNLRLKEEPPSWEMQKGTKEYYLKLAKENVDREYLVRLSKPKETKVVGAQLLERQEYIKHLRFAALAHLEDDAGFDAQSMEDDWWKSKTVRPRDYYLPQMKDKVIYMDKIEGNSSIKNYYEDQQSSFKMEIRRIEKPPNVHRKPIQDSKQRYRHASN